MVGKHSTMKLQLYKMALRFLNHIYHMSFQGLISGNNALLLLQLEFHVSIDRFICMYFTL